MLVIRPTYLVIVMPEPYVTSEQFEREIRAGAERGKQLDTISNQMDSLSRWRVEIDQRLDKHSHTLYGNGSPGMDEMMRRVLAFVERQEKAEETRWSDTKKFVLGALAFIVNTLLAIVISGLLG
jgi:hypothetical protein